jgi:prepilin-type N-terminal cleavage/methylation domain-containing protein
MNQFNNFKIKNKGLTLIEMLVAVTIFSIIVGAIAGIFISGIQSQRRVLATQELLDQTSYVIEYMSRALRMARKELAIDPAKACLLEDSTTILYGQNYQLRDIDQDGEVDGIRFLNYEGKCQQFFLEDGKLYEIKSTDSSVANFGSPYFLTSPLLSINSLKFNLSGENQTDLFQPRVTIFLEISGREIKGGRPKIQIQTTISQRNLDQ